MSCLEPARESGLEPDPLTQRIKTWSPFRICSDLELFTNRRKAQRLLEPLGLKSGFIFTPVYQTDCSDQWRRSLFLKCLCSVMLTADWSWRGKVLLFMKFRWEKKRERSSVVSTELTEGCSEFNHTDTHTHTHTHPLHIFSRFCSEKNPAYTHHILYLYTNFGILMML